MADAVLSAFYVINDLILTAVLCSRYPSLFLL